MFFLYDDEHVVNRTNICAILVVLLESRWSKGVKLYVFHVSLTDFHCFDWLTDVRGNPYGYFFIFFKLNFYFIFIFITTRDLHELSIKMAFVETICLP